MSEEEPRIVSASDVLGLAAEAVARWSLSPAHASALFDPDYGAVNYGLAYDSRNWRVVAVFESDFVEDRGTSVSYIDGSGRIVSSGFLTEEAYAAGYRLSLAEVRYDSPPMAMTRGKLARTSFYGEGKLLMVASDQAGSRSVNVTEYADPYEFGEELEPLSETEANTLFEIAKTPLGSYTAVYEFVPIEFRTDGRAFEFAASEQLSLRYLCDGVGICDRIKPGVYTITLLGLGPDGRLVKMASDSTWFGLDRPAVVDVVTSLVGGSSGSSGSVEGNESGSMGTPEVVSIEATTGISGMVKVTFSEPVYVSGIVGVSVRDKGYIRCAAASVPPVASDSCPASAELARDILTFDTGEIELEGMDVIEKIALGRGGSIRDVDGDAVFYSLFQPMTMP